MSIFENYNEEEIFEYQIWELQLKIDAANAHIQEFKENEKFFKSERVKGTDTVFYEMNLPEWERMMEVSLKQFEKDYKRKYNKENVRHTRRK